MPIDETPPDTPVLQSLESQLNPVSSWEQATAPVDPLAAINQTGKQLRGVLGTPYQVERQVQNVQDPFGLESVVGGFLGVQPAQPQAPRMLTAKDAQDQYGVPGFLAYDKPVSEDEAQQDNIVARHQQWQAMIAAHAPASLPASLGGMLLGALTDPTNDILAMSGIGDVMAGGLFGEEATAGAAGAADMTGGMGRFGKLWSTAPRAFGRAAVTNVPFVAKDAALAFSSGHPEDFDLGQELATVVGFSVLDAGIHAGATALGWLPKHAPAEPPEAAGREGAIPMPPEPAGPAAPAAAARAGAFEPEGGLPGEVGELHAAPEPEPPGVPPDVHAMAREIDPETFEKYDALAAEKAMHRDALVGLGGERVNLAEAVDAQATIDRIMQLTGRRFANQRAALADAQATLARVTSDDSPQMAATRQALLQADYGMRDLAPRVSAAYRDAQAIVEGSTPYSSSPAGLGRPPEVERLTPNERIASIVTAIDDVRQGNPTRVGEMISGALQARAPEGLVGGEGVDAAPLTDGEQAMADAARFQPGHLEALSGEDREARTAAAQELFARSPRKVFGEQPLDEAGRVTPAGERRIEMAVAARAYGDRTLVEALYSAAGRVLSGVGRALREVAPEWAAMREAMERGEAPAALDLTDHLVSATRLLKASRETLPVEGAERSFLQTQLEGRMFDSQTISPESEGLLRAFFRNEELTQPTAGDKVARILRQYAEWAKSQVEETGRGEERNASAGSARLQALYRKHLRGWDDRAGVVRPPGGPPGEGGPTGGTGAGVRQHGAAGGEPRGGGLPGEDSLQPAGGGEGAAVLGGASELGSADDAGPGGAEPAVPGEPGREPAAGADEGGGAAAAGDGRDAVSVNPATAASIIEADPVLRDLRGELENFMRQSGKAPEYGQGEDPATIAEAVRAMAVCLKGEL
jgi:hypothetical protein